MEHQERNELLLSRTRQTGRDVAFDDDTEPAEEFDAQGWSNSHPARLYMFGRAVDPLILRILVHRRTADSPLHAKAVIQISR
jgi:hypothetical protein